MKNQYKLHIHHRSKQINKDDKGNIELASSPGHFFVSLQNGYNITYFGKYPAGNSYFSDESIKTDEERQLYEDLKKMSAISGEEYITTKTFQLTEEQYKKAFRFVKSKSTQTSSDNFILGVWDCTDFVQCVYNAAGLPLYFTIAYTIDELFSLKSMAALKVFSRYGSRSTMPQQFHCIESLSKQELTARLNVNSDIIVQIPTFQHWDLPPSSSGISIQFHVNVDKTMMKSVEELILKDNIFDVDLMGNRIHDIFMTFKIQENPSEDTRKETTKNIETFPNYPNFEKLKDIIISNLEKFREEFNKLRSIKPPITSESKTQEELLKIYEEKMKELQAKFMATQEFVKNNPGKYQYEPGETLPGMADFNRAQAKLNQWLTEELGKLSNPPFGITSSVSDSSTAILQAKLVDNWNYAIEHLSQNPKFNEDLKDTLSNVSGVGELISQYLEDFIEEQKTICKKNNIY